MTVKLPMLVMTALIGVSILISAHGKDEKVPVEQCPAVVEHVKFIQGVKSPSIAAMMAECKVASDEERGCLISAGSRRQLAQCLS